MKAFGLLAWLFILSVLFALSVDGPDHARGKALTAMILFVIVSLLVVGLRR